MNPGHVLSNLNGAAMLVAQAHRRRLGFYLDAVYGDLTVGNSRTVQQVSLSANTRVDMTILTVAPSDALHQSPTLFWMVPWVQVSFVKTPVQQFDGLKQDSPRALQRRRVLVWDIRLARVTSLWSPKRLLPTHA